MLVYGGGSWKHVPPPICDFSMKEVKDMGVYKKRYGRVKGSIIKYQSDEIRSLKRQINELNISNQKKDELINSVDGFQKELDNIVADLRAKKEEYNELINEVKTMRSVFNEEVFKGRWNIIKWLLK